MNGANKLLRRIREIDFIIDDKLDRVTRVCDYDKDEFYNAIRDWSIERVKYDYFGGDISEIYGFMLDYVRKVHKDKIDEFYDSKCSSPRRLKENENRHLMFVLRRVDLNQLLEIIDRGIGLGEHRFYLYQNKWNNMNLQKYEAMIMGYIMEDVSVKLGRFTEGILENYNEIYNDLMDLLKPKIKRSYMKVNKK